MPISEPRQQQQPPTSPRWKKLSSFTHVPPPYHYLYSISMILYIFPPLYYPLFSVLHSLPTVATTVCHHLFEKNVKTKATAENAKFFPSPFSFSSQNNHVLEWCFSYFSPSQKNNPKGVVVVLWIYNMTFYDKTTKSYSPPLQCFWKIN